MQGGGVKTERDTVDFDVGDWSVINQREVSFGYIVDCLGGIRNIG